MQPLQLLLIEDNLGDARLFEEKLKESPAKAYTLDISNSLEAAAKLLKDKVFDLIFLDLNLPDAEGLPLVRKIQHNASNVPIVVLTGMDDEMLASQMLRSGIQDYLIKGENEGRTLWRSIRYALERKEFEDNLRRAKDSAEAAAKVRADFLAHMSHEIRNPLHVLLGVVDVMARHPQDMDIQSLISLADSSGKQILYIIDDILHLSKYEAGKLKIEHIPFDLVGLINEVSAGAEIRAKGKNLFFHAVTFPGLPPIVHGDRHKLQQVLNNLISNSIKFTESGRVDLTVSLKSQDVNGCIVQFVIEDTGIGIPEDKQQLVFEAFSQADVSTERIYGGSGLGLAICLKFVSLMGGQIWLESVPKKGSKFTFTIRFGGQEQNQSVHIKQNKPEFVCDVDSRRPAELNGSSILVVDDSTYTHQIIKMYLHGSAWKVDSALSGEEALKRLDNHLYKVVLVDWEMHGMSGPELIRSYHEQKGSSVESIFILMTGRSSQEDIIAGLKSGARTVLAKPFSERQFYDVMEKFSPNATFIEKKPSVQDVPFVGSEIKVPLIMRELVSEYLSKKNDEIATLQLALAKNDWEVIRSIGHNMKGTGQTYGFPEITAVGLRIETLAHECDEKMVAEQLQKLKTYLSSVRVVSSENEK